MSSQKVLFVCTGNSCRSQMAEGLLRHIAGDRFEVASGGTEAERMSVFRRVRDQIAERVRKFAAE